MNLHDLVAARWYAIPSALGVIFGLLLIWKWVEGTRIGATLLRARTTLAAWEPTAEDADDDLRRFIRPFLVADSRAALRTWRSPRLIVSRDLDSIVESYVEHRTSGYLFSVGSAATGVALLCTFGLIAYVLSVDIRNALTASGAGAEQTLASAVGLLGQKFAISATGIVLAIAFAVANAQIRKRLSAASHALCAEVGPGFATPDTLAAASQLELLDESRRNNDAAAKQEAILEAMTGHLVGIQEVLEHTRTDLDKLKSIEVSVQSIGSEVAHQVRLMITADLADQIRGILADVMVQADELSSRLQRELVDAFQKTLDHELPKIVGSLDEIKKSVENQAALPVERMLDQLQGIVSGGMRGESAQMSAALRQFGEVVPALADQLRSVASSLSSELSSRAEENARTSDALMRQVAGLLERMEAQQTASERAIADITRAATAGAESMAQRLESTSGDFVAKLLQTSRAEVEALAVRLKDAANANASGYATLEQSVAGASKSILEARDGLAEAAVAMRTLATDVRGVVQEARQSTESARAAATGFETAATTLRNGVTAMQQALESARVQATEQRAVLDEHRRVLKELEAAWPRLFQVYLKSFDEKSTALAQSWDEVYARVSTLSNNVAGGLVEAAEELKVSVDRLATLHKGTNGRPG